MAVRKDASPVPKSSSIPSLEVYPEDLTKIRLIGSGGFGIVFKATHKRWCIEVALKCAKGSRQLSQSNDSDLLKEAHKMKTAQFDFILPLRGYIAGISSKQMNLTPDDLSLCSQILYGGGPSLRELKREFSFSHALVMPYMPRGSLQGLLQRCGQAAEARGRGPGLPWPLRSRFVDQIAHGMNYLHELKPHPLLHLDLKPQNVLLDDDYHVKICDFGLSKWREVTGQLGDADSPTYIESLCLQDAVPSRDRKTAGDFDHQEILRESTFSIAESTKLLGTLPYVPPEYLQDTHRKPQYTFDVYSFAIVLWEILTLSTPYANAVNSIHVVECVVKEHQRPSIDDIPKDRPRPVENLISLMKKCWHLDPEHRPTFHDCIKVTQPVFNAFKDKILTARQELHTMLSLSDDQELPGWGEANLTTKILRPVQETSKPSCVESSVQMEHSTHHDGTTSKTTMDDAPNVRVTKQELIKVARLLGNKWKAVGRSLSLTEAQLENLQHDYQNYTMDEVAYQMLRIWHEREGRNATSRTLKNALKLAKVSAEDFL